MVRACCAWLRIRRLSRLSVFVPTNFDRLLGKSAIFGGKRAVASSEYRSTARQVSEKEQNSSVRRQPVRCPLSLELGIALDGQTDK